MAIPLLLALADAAPVTGAIATIAPSDRTPSLPVRVAVLNRLEEPVSELAACVVEDDLRCDPVLVSREGGEWLLSVVDLTRPIRISAPGFVPGGFLLLADSSSVTSR